MTPLLLRVAASWVFWATPLLAHEAPQLPRLSLAKIVALAGERSALVRADAQAHEAEKQKVAQSTTWQNPSLALAFGRIANDEARGAILEGTLSQTIPFPGKLGARERAAEFNERIAAADAQKSRLQVQAEAFALSYQLAALHHLTEHIEDRHRRFAMVRSFLASRSSAVPAQRAEKLLVENKLLLLEEHLIEKKAQQQQTWLALQQLVQEPREFVPEVSWWTKPLGTLPAKLLAGDDSPFLQRQRFSLQKAEAELTVGHRNVLPDFNLGIGYRSERPGSPTHFYTGYLTVAIPLFDYGQHSVAALEHQLEAERLRTEAAKLSNRRRLETAFGEVKRASEVALLHPIASLPKLEKDFLEAETEFRRGRLPIITYLEVEAQSHELQDHVFESQAQLARAAADLSVLAGELLTFEENPDAR